MPKIELNDTRRCNECGCFNSHTADCSQVTVEQMKQYLSNYRKSIEQHIKVQRTHWNTWDRLRKEIDRWHGKYLIVKHENNKLRNKLK